MTANSSKRSLPQKRETEDPEGSKEIHSLWGLLILETAFPSTRPQQGSNPDQGKKTLYLLLDFDEWPP